MSSTRLMISIYTQSLSLIEFTNNCKASEQPFEDFSESPSQHCLLLVVKEYIILQNNTPKS